MGEYIICILNKLSIILCAFFLIWTFIISNCIGNKELILKDKEYGALFDSKDLDDEFDNISISKSCEGRLDRLRKKKIINSMARKLNGQIIDVKNISNNCGMYSEKEMIRVYGYSRMLKNDRKYMGRRINFSIVITYNKTDNTTDVYFGSPIVNIDF